MFISSPPNWTYSSIQIYSYCTASPQNNIFRYIPQINTFYLLWHDLLNIMPASLPSKVKNRRSRNWDEYFLSVKTFIHIDFPFENSLKPVHALAHFLNGDFLHLQNSPSENFSLVKYTSKFNEIFHIISSPIHRINFSFRPDILSIFKPKNCTKNIIFKHSRN